MNADRDVLSRAELAAEAARLRGDGLLIREITARLGVSYSYAAELCTDPTGERARARKDSYAQPCVDCGDPTSGSEGRRSEPRCRSCAASLSWADRMVWTRERIIEAIQWWNERYGEPPAMCDWNPHMAVARLGDAARAERATRHIAAGEVPWCTVTYRVFGSWNAAIIAAGFEPRKPNGGGENGLRRRSGSGMQRTSRRAANAG